MRERIKKPATRRAQELVLMDLSKLGGDPNEILLQSIKNSWQGVFALKGGTSGNNSKKLTPEEQGFTGKGMVSVE